MSVANPIREITLAADWAQIADAIRRRRKDLNLDQRDAARRSALTKRTWERLEDDYGAYLSDAALAAVARTLNLKPETFLGRCGRATAPGTALDGTPTAPGADWSGFGDYVRRRRKELDLDQSEAARRARVPKSIWKDLEDGYGAGLAGPVLLRVARALSLAPAKFMARGRRPYQAPVDPRRQAEERAAEAEARAIEADTRAVQAEARAALAEARAAEAESLAVGAADRAAVAEAGATRSGKAADRALERARTAEALVATTQEQLAQERTRTAQANRTVQELRKEQGRAAAERKAEQAPSQAGPGRKPPGASGK
ncbi:MAG: hypothetical protein ACRDZ7_12830 [Acidimicrobiia bacterium]